DGAGGLNALRAARSRNAEVGVRGRHEALAYSAALFDSRTRDEVVVVANEGGRSVYGNAGRSRRRGAEFSVSGTLAPRWHYAAAYTWMDARYVGDFRVCTQAPCGAGDVLVEDGRRIPGLSRHAAWAELRWSADAHTDVVFDGRAADRVHVDDGSNESAPGYAVFSLAAELRAVRAAVAGLRRGRQPVRPRVRRFGDRQRRQRALLRAGAGTRVDAGPARGMGVPLSAGAVCGEDCVHAPLRRAA